MGNVLDMDDREWEYRREDLTADGINLVEGENLPGAFDVKEIVEYLPPWEAFCHEKCGFYQDFYLVKWKYPYSEVDYSKTENGCTWMIGATWEPDECLPAHLDALRYAAKKAWVMKHRDELLRERRK